MIISGMVSGGAAGAAAQPTVAAPEPLNRPVAPAPAQEAEKPRGASAANEAPASKELSPTQTVLAPASARDVDRLPTEQTVLPWPSKVDTRPPAPQAEFFEALIAARTIEEAAPPPAEAPEAAPADAPTEAVAEIVEEAPAPAAPAAKETPPAPETEAPKAESVPSDAASDRFREGLNAVRDEG
ncbi:MAG: hypothetical protein AAGF90_06965 [Pseudomonadota bacterium]